MLESYFTRLFPLEVLYSGSIISSNTNKMDSEEENGHHVFLNSNLPDYIFDEL